MSFIGRPHKIKSTLLRSLKCFHSSTGLKNDEKPLTPLRELKKLNIQIPKANKMPSRPIIPESDFEEKFIKGGSGKGGQKINKTNSKVQLTHKATGIVVTSQATRSRDQNRKIAREILAMKIEELEKGVQSRTQIVIARKQMLKQRAKRKTKSKYKKLANESEGKNREEDDGEEEEEEEVIVIVDDDEPADMQYNKKK